MNFFEFLISRNFFLGFAFIEYELPEDAQAAIDNMNDSEMFGRTLRVNIAKPLRIKENSSRPVWQDEEWLQVFSRDFLFISFSRKNSGSI